MQHHCTPIVETGHQAMIHDAQLDYYSRRLATCSSDRSIKIFLVNDANGQQLLSELGGHDGPVWAVQWAHPRFGNLLASCGYDAKVIVHREHAANQWAPIYTFNHKSSVNAVQFAPHEYGLIMACASSDGTVSVHTFENDNSWSVRHIEVSKLGVNSVTWAPPTALGSQGELTGSQTLRLATGSCDNTVKVWKFEEDGGTEWEQECVLKMHTDWVRDVAWCPSIAVPINTLASASQDGTVVMWSQETEGGDWTAHLLNKFPAPVWRVSWSLTGNVLGVATGDNQHSLWKETVDKKWEEMAMEGEKEAGANPEEQPPAKDGAPGESPATGAPVDAEPASAALPQQQAPPQQQQAPPQQQQGYPQQQQGYPQAPPQQQQGYPQAPPQQQQGYPQAPPQQQQNY